jgi:hypothetical protein
MANKQEIHNQETAIQNLLGQFLTARKSAAEVDAGQDAHLDQDTLAAFVEGNLNERASGPVVAHLVCCSFCRNITAELIRLDLDFAEYGTAEARAAVSEPGPISEVLGGLFSRIFGTSDGAVFAHQESDPDGDDGSEESSTDDQK